MASGGLPGTSTLAAAWCNRLVEFCTQLQRNCTSLYALVQRKPEPEPRGDNFDSFLEDLNDDVSTALAQLQQLEERTKDILSFEELLVHCDALYESNKDGISELELQLQQYGYIPVEAPKEIHAELLQGTTDQENDTDSQSLDDAFSPPRSTPNRSSINGYEASVVTPMALSYEFRNIKRDVEYSPLFGDLGDIGSLESLGISATSLTALAGQDESGEGSASVHPLQHKLSFTESPTRKHAKISRRDAEMEETLKAKYGSHWNSEAEFHYPLAPSVPVAKYGSTCENDERPLEPVAFKKFEAESKHPPLPSIPVAKHGSTYGNDERLLEPVVSIPTTTVSKKDVTLQSLETKKVTFLDQVTTVQYENSPIYLRLSISLQELNGAVTKINDLIRQRSDVGQHANQFVLDQNDIQTLGLGSKAKACLVLLTLADKLATQSTNGVTTYRICI